MAVRRRKQHKLEIHVCTADKQRFFDTLGSIIKDMAKTAMTNPDFIAALSALESSWLGPHAEALHNPFGLTEAGGNDLNFASYEEARNYWLYRAAKDKKGYARVFRGINRIDDFTLTAFNNGYNSADPGWQAKVKRVYLTSILPYKEVCKF